MAQRNTVIWCHHKRRTCDTTSLTCEDCPRKARENRPSRSKRGYNSEWYRIRKEVLQQYGIPREMWPQYDVDHNPPYNPEIEPDHRKYTLVPMLRADHSRKTVNEDMRRDSEGKFIKKK
jgi:hypothetical protein